MGNNASNQYEQIQHKTDFTFTYQLLKKVNEPHYGEVKVVRDIKTGEQIFLKEVVLTTKDTYQAELDFYNKRISVSHPNVVRIFGCNGTDQQNFCSSYFKISVFIEMLPKTLAHELESRFESGVPFSENDILLIAENLIAGLSYFEAQDVFHGDIRPENIFVSSNAYKLSDPNLYPQKSANALSHVLLGNAKTLLSPELLAQVPNHDFAIKCNKFKADVFSLGATLLSLASLTDAKELYDYENGGFDLDGLQERLELVRKTYSKFTFELIRDMLKIHEEQRPDFIALSNRLLPYQEDIRQKYELPFFGIRAPYEEKREEDHLDISRYTYEEKSNPVLMDFINSQMSQSSVKRKPQRDSNGSSSRAEDITPGHPSHGHNAFGRERDSAQESYRKSGNLMAEFEKTEVNQSPYRQEVASGYMQSHLAEQLYREDPTRNPFQRNVQPVPPQQFEQNRRTQPYPLLNIQQHQQHQEHPSQQTGKVDTARSSQVRNEAPVEVFERQYHEPQYEQQVRYEPPKRSYAQEPQTHRQLELQQQQQQQQQQQYQQQQQQQQVYFQPQIQYQPTQTPVHIEPKVPLYLSESHIQAQIQRQENTNEPPQGESSDLDDLEAKIKAALERSEATYKRASRPAYQGSPDKHQSAKKSAPPTAESANVNYQQLSYSAYPTQRVSGYDIPEVPANIITSSSVYVKPTELEDATNLQYVKPANLYSQSFARAHDLNNSPPNQSEMQTNVQSNENTLYDFNPTFLSQSGVSNGNYYTTTTPVGYTSQYNQSTSYPATATLQYQQRLPSGESWERAGIQYDNKGINKDFYSFATPLGPDTLQRHEHNALINGDHKNLIQHVIQD